MKETTIQGQRVRLLESWEVPGLVLDRWENPAEPEGSWRRVGVVVLVTDDAEHLPDEDPNLPWGDTWAVGYTNHPSDDPAERFAEAVRQERARAAERLGGPVEFQQAWPPAGTRTLVASVTAEDTRDGWVRVDWLPDGQVVVQGAPADLVAQVPDSRTEGDVLAWAEGHGFGSVNPPGGVPPGRGRPRREQRPPGPPLSSQENDAVATDGPR